MKKEIKRKNEIIQGEQAQLRIIQKELEDLLTKVNESINTLKVEELQLKSSAVFCGSSSSLSTQSSMTLKKPRLTTDTSTSFSNWSQKSNPVESSIDKQNVDLDLNTFHNPRLDVEEDDE